MDLTKLTLIGLVALTGCGGSAVTPDLIRPTLALTFWGGPPVQVKEPTADGTGQWVDFLPAPTEAQQGYYPDWPHGVDRIAWDTPPAGEYLIRVRQTTGPNAPALPYTIFVWLDGVVWQEWDGVLEASEEGGLRQDVYYFDLN